MSRTTHIQLALTKLGIAPVLMHGQSVPQASLLDAMYDHVLDLCLRAHNWSFAMHFVTGLALVQKAPPGYAYAFAEPLGLLRIVDVRQSLNTPPVEFSLVGNLICTNEQNPLLRYIARPTTDIFPPDFVQVLVLRLAAEGAPLIAQSSAKQTELMQMYYMELEYAQTTDERADNTTEPDELENSDLLNARG